MTKKTFVQKADHIEERRASMVALIEPRSLTRQCLLAWLEQHEPAFELHAFATLADFLDQRPNEVGLVIWSLGASSIASSPMQAELKRLRDQVPDSPLVIVADQADQANIREALQLGANGYLPTSLDRREAIEVLRFVQAGGTYVPASVLLERSVPCETEERPCSQTQRAQVFQNLTPREADVVERLRQGKPNKIIAHELKISESTVKVFVHRILHKLGAVNRTEVAYLAQQRTDRINAPSNSLA